MNFLVLDTSTKNFSLAAVRAGKVVAQRNTFKDKILSSSIIPEIDQILKKAKLSLAKLDGFVIGLGPGSFTSLRVGLSTIKALALVTGKPVVGIPSLDAVAFNVQAKTAGTGDICVVSDAKRQLVYACVYQKQNGSLKRKSKYLLTSMDDVLKGIKGPAIFTGDAVDICRDQISKSGSRCEDKRYWKPQARCLWELAKPLIEKERFDDIDRLLPLYLYPEHCQVQR